MLFHCIWIKYLVIFLTKSLTGKVFVCSLFTITIRFCSCYQELAMNGLNSVTGFLNSFTKSGDLHVITFS